MRDGGVVTEPQRTGRLRYPPEPTGRVSRRQMPKPDCARRHGGYLGMHTCRQFRSILPDTRGVRMRHASGCVRILAALLVILTTPALAQQRQTPPVARPPEIPGQQTAPPDAMKRGLRDRGELEAFIDGVMQANLRDKHVAGAT